MKKRITAAVIMSTASILLLAGCGGTADKKITETAESKAESMATQNESKNEEKTEEATIADVPKENNSQPADKEGSFQETAAGDEAQETTSKAKTMTVQQCEDEIQLLSGTEPVHPANQEVLKTMADCATTAGVVDKTGVIFAQMNNDERARIRYRFLEAAMWQSSLHCQDLAVEIDEYTWGMPLEDAGKLFSDGYGEEDFSPAEREQIIDGNIVMPFADGEAVDLIVGMQFFEDDDFILLSGPLFYESNGEGELFEGCADILFAKNADSRFGATLVYGRCRDVDIKISSVEASSELKGSGSKSYSPKNLIDKDPSTAWVEGAKGTGVGETITLYLDKKQPVYGIQLVNGYTAGYEQYINNGTVTSVKVDFGGGVFAESDELVGYGNVNFTAQELAEINRFRIGLDEPVTTDTITITITGAAEGEKYDDICISEIWVYGSGEADS